MLQVSHKRRSCEVRPLSNRAEFQLTDIHRYSGLDTDETVVYNYIESVGRDGAWIKSIQTYSNLHISVVNKCLKSLESKSLIKRILNAKNPLKKVYLLFHLQPAEDVTGGSFYTDGTLDEEFIHQLCLWIENYVLRKSWYIEVPKSSKKKIKYKTTTEEAESTRAEVLQDHSKDGGRLLPMPPGYTGYPTLSEITRAINEFQISQVALKEAEVERLLDLLCWDGKLMKVLNGRFYKSVRASIQRENGAIANGLAESPCGRCPVFDLCEDGGPVNSRTCPYFKDWLGLNF